jgi:hypothetical protein
MFALVFIVCYCIIVTIWHSLLLQRPIMWFSFDVYIYLVFWNINILHCSVTNHWFSCVLLFVVIIVCWSYIAFIYVLSLFSFVLSLISLKFCEVMFSSAWRYNVLNIVILIVWTLNVSSKMLELKSSHSDQSCGFH